MALAIERIEGERLAFAVQDPESAPRRVSELRAILDAIHARGVAHNDLRGRENVLLREDGGLAVLDFAGSIRLRPGGIAHRLFFRWLTLADEAAFLKWKGMIAPGTYTKEDEAFLRRFERWRGLWPFNPKRRKASSGRGMISVVAPVYNERENLRPLVDELLGVLLRVDGVLRDHPRR